MYGVELNADGTRVRGEKFRIAGDAYEATYILKKGGYYSYFGSTGSCCEGASSTYRVKVGRSTVLEGPYLDSEGKPLLETGGARVRQDHTALAGPGHNEEVVTAEIGHDWLVYPASTCAA